MFISAYALYSANLVINLRVLLLSICPSTLSFFGSFSHSTTKMLFNAIPRPFQAFSRNKQNTPKKHNSAVLLEKNCCTVPQPLDAQLESACKRFKKRTKILRIF